MANLKKLKNQIKALEKTKQITKAMHSISASKIKKSEESLNSFKVFKYEFENIFKVIKKRLTETRIKNENNDISLYILISSDRGLAGNFHSQLFKSFSKHLESIKNNSYVYTIGRKAYYYVKDNKYNLLNNKIVFNRDDVDTIDLENLSLVFKDIYEQKGISSVYLYYQKEEKAFVYKPHLEKILPFSFEEEKKENENAFIFETDLEEMFIKLVYTYLETKIYNALLNSKKCEHSARLVAMKNASDNAEKVIDKLLLKYNHERQQAITSELIDVVNGAKGGF